MKFDTEKFLKEYHAVHPGCTPKAMAMGRTTAGVSSYGVISEEVSGIRGRILDLACGDGYLLSMLQAAGHSPADLFGIDMSEEELAVARGRLPGVRILQGNARSLSFPAGNFEAVTCHMALMLIPDVHEVIAEIARVLAPGGKFVAITSGRFIKTPAYDLYLEKIGSLLAEEGKIFLKDLGDGRVSTAEGAQSLFSPGNGFSAVSFNDDSIEYDLPPENVVDLYMQSYAPFLLSHEAQTRLREFLHGSFVEMSGSNGRLKDTKGLRKIVAERAR